MKTLIELVMAHQVTALFLLGVIWNSYVDSLDAPTKNSSASYVFLFKFSNFVALNFKRSRSTSIENSPNFKDAVALHLAAQAQCRADANSAKVVEITEPGSPQPPHKP
jgi:hypothetical protein